MKKEQTPRSCRLNKVGGQALLEGVMMKSGDDVVLSVRRDDGSIVTASDKFVSAKKKCKILGWPIIRGILGFVESLLLSFRTLSRSIDMLGLDEMEEETKFDKWLKEHLGDKLTGIIMGIATVLGLALGVGLFVFLPTLVTRLVNDYIIELGWVKNLVEGVIKIGIFVLYMWLVSFMGDIRRTFEYHGAEHKSIACYEEGMELTPANAAKCSRLHPRCGTSFMIVMLILSILVFSLPIVPWDNILLRVVIKLALLPLVMGLGYEFIMYAGKHDNVLTRVLSAPGLWMQRITTREPDEKQLEIAITSIKLALKDEFPDFNPATYSRKAEDTAEEATEEASEEASEDAE